MKHGLVLTTRDNWLNEMEVWATNQVKQKQWSFDSLYLPEDMLQELRILYWKLFNAYPSVTQPQHFFTICKVATKNFLIDKQRFKKRRIEYDCVDDLSELFNDFDYNGGPIALILEELPDELKLVLRVLTTGRVRLKVDRPVRGKPKVRETLNARLRRKLKLESANPVGDLKTFLSNA